MDSRERSNQKHLYHILLLVCSWHANVVDKTRFPIEVITIGELSAPLIDCFSDLGVAHVESSPHPHTLFCPYCNKLLGAKEPLKDDRILLVDNDVVVLREPAELDTMSAECVAAAIAGRSKLTPEHWALIEQNLRLVPLKSSWLSLRDQFQAIVEKTPGKWVEPLYFNSGVILLPQASDFALLWETHCERIAGFFSDHPLRAKCVYLGVDQAALATACGAYGHFQSLPHRFNFRPPCFWLGKARFDEISITHLTTFLGGVKQFPIALVDSVHTFWNRRIDTPIESLKGKIPDTALDQRRETSARCREHIIEICKSYNLDSLTKKCLAS